MPSYNFEVPGEPQPWRRARRGKDGHSFVDPKTADYRSRIALFARMSGVGIIEGPVEVVVHAFWPARQPPRKREPRPEEWKDTRPDGDNILKVVCEALEGVGFRDDGQVSHATVTKRRAAQGEPARLDITLGSLA